MDQLKPIIAALKKHYFWIVMVIVIGTSLTFFYMSNSTLNSEISSRKSTIESQYGKVREVSNKVATHPNDESAKEMKAIIDVHKNDVQAAWSAQYERQKRYLKWPKNVTREEAIEKLDKMRPIELTVQNPLPAADDPLSVSYREMYRDYVNNVFPEIAKTIGAKWTVGTTPDTTAMTNPVVKWEDASQKKLFSQIAPWYGPGKAPSTLDILYTQEDLWILSGLMNIIKSVNGDARENFQAPIKEIKWIRLGRMANGSAGEIEEFKKTAAAADSAYGGGGGGYGGGGGGAASVGGGGGGSPYGGIASTATADPANNRYVDSNFKPVSSADLISKMKSGNPQDAFFAVAKRIPIQLRLNMDQRKVADLVAACGNNDLVVEIKQLRYGAEESKEGSTVESTGAAMGGAAPGGPAGGGYGSSYSGGPAQTGGGGGAYGDGASSNVTWKDKGYELDVEIYGIVLLYNPVDIKQLGIEKVEQTTQLETTAEAPAATPAPSVATPAAPAPATPATTEVPATPAPATPAPAPSDQPPAGTQPPVVPPTPPATESATTTPATAAVAASGN